MIDKIVEGKMERFYSEVCLLEQTYVKDADLTIKEVLDAMIGKDRRKHSHPSVRPISTG